MINQVDSWWWFKLNGILRWCLVHRIIPSNSIVLTEYPKSGGTWISNMLSDALNIPFPRNRLPLLKKQILHGHYINSWNIKNPVVLFRDVRDIIISQYYHYLIPNGKNEYLVNKMRQIVKFKDYEDIKLNLNEWIHIFFSGKITKFTWTEFVNIWLNEKSSIFITYEAFRKEPINELIKVVNALGYELDKKVALEIVDRYSFEKLTGRKAGEENKNSFLRKGIVGDWKNYFDEESKELVKYYAGKELIQLKYEEDLNW